MSVSVLQWKRTSIWVLALWLIGGPVLAESLERAVEAFDFEEYEDAAQWLKPWAQKGEPEAQYRYGIMLEEGLAMKRNPEEARMWFKQAAEAGHVAAAKRLKKLQRSTINTDSKESVAFDWYQEKADQGDIEAQYRLGFMYETGWSTPKDETRAANWYEEAASGNHVQAQLRLGIMYLAGAGVAPSEIQAKRWLKAAADNNNKLAQYLLKQMIEAPANLALNKSEMAVEIRRITVDKEKQVRSYVDSIVRKARARLRKEQAASEAQLAKSKKIESATEQAVKPANLDIGLDAKGRKTLVWYQHNAERGNAEAQYGLARRYTEGQDVEVDLQQAMKWFLLAAEQGYAQAQYYLAMAYIYGIGVDANADAGREWLQRAVASGHEQAGAEFARLKSEWDEDSAQTVAAWWLRYWGEEHPEAYQDLAYLYDHGRGVEPDRIASMEWNAMAAKYRFEQSLLPAEETPPADVTISADKNVKAVRQPSPAVAVAESSTALPEEPTAASQTKIVQEEVAGVIPSAEEVTAAEGVSRMPTAEPVQEELSAPESAQDSSMDSVEQFLELDKLKANWLWLLLLAVVLVLIRFFASRQSPEEVESPFQESN